MRSGLGIGAAILAVGFATPAAAEAWRVAAASNLAIMMVDTDSISRRGNTVFATVITIAPPQSANDWDRSVIRREIDCANGRSAMLERAFYRGNRLISRETAREPFDNHAAASMMGGVLQTVCGSRDYQSAVLSDPVGTAWAMLRSGK